MKSIPPPASYHPKKLYQVILPFLVLDIILVIPLVLFLFCFYFRLFSLNFLSFFACFALGVIQTVLAIIWFFYFKDGFLFDLHSYRDYRKNQAEE